MTPVDLRATAGAPRRTAHDYVLETLRAAILNGDLSGGTRLVQAEVARQLGVSTTPVREALRALSTEGLVVLDAHRGGIVKQLTIEELHEIHALCRILEPEALRQAAPVIGDEVLSEARRLNDAMEATSDVAERTELNRRFHDLLVGEAPSPRLVAILRGLRSSAAPYVALAHRRHGAEQFGRANQEHREILAALERRDAERAAQLVGEHVLLAGRLLEQHRDLFDSR